MAQRVFSDRPRSNIESCHDDGARIEVRLVPLKQQPGFLWSYVWTIELVASERERLLAMMQKRASSTQFAAEVRCIVERAAQQGLPFGPGTLRDYELVENETVLRIDLCRHRTPQ